MQNRTPLLTAVALLLAGLGPTLSSAQELRDDRETRFGDVRQLTFQGENAEAYWAFDGSKLVFQSTPTPGEGCDQIFILDPETGETSPVSSGGRTTCSYFHPNGNEVLYSSTHHYDLACPANPDFSMGYVWPVYPSMDIFIANSDGTNVRQLTTEFGYDAEATVSPTGDRVVFTSMRNGDLDLYTMNLDGTDVRQVTDRLGYDGGAFFSPDGTKLLWRAHYPETEQEIADYRRLLAQGLIRPSALEIYIADVDGSNVRQITDNGAANFAPYWHPSGEKLAFSSNYGDPQGREFNIFLINTDGTGLEQVTFTEDFDGFPVFSADGTQLVFGSNRNKAHDGNTNIFIAEWLDGN